jgi:hypothetical protein
MRWSLLRSETRRHSVTRDTTAAPRFKLCLSLPLLRASYMPSRKPRHQETTRKPAMIDFEVPAEAKAIREKVRTWVHEECIPAEKELDTKPLAEVLGPLRAKARARGLWCPWVPKEYGGMGLGPLANALVQMELGESSLGALSLNTQGPDDASMLTLLAHGTEYQKEKFLKPLLAGEKRVCFSMTEKASGADATGMQTSAVKDGNENYILNGENGSPPRPASPTSPSSWRRRIPTRRAATSSRPSSSSCRIPATRSNATSRTWRSRVRTTTSSRAATLKSSSRT